MRLRSLERSKDFAVTLPEESIDMRRALFQNSSMGAGPLLTSISQKDKPLTSMRRRVTSFGMFCEV
jgi:hypothetical protein